MPQQATPRPDTPRPEYPRPQFVREDWLTLNGSWEFEIDTADTGLDRGLLDAPYGRSILVPFCPESDLSGIGETDFMDVVWYRRTVSVPAGWRGRRLLLHFQAVDHDTTVWVDGIEVVRHRGGFTPFTADLGVREEAGEELTIVVRARDPHSGPQARGKQSTRRENLGATYTRTTGIWQTVWLEPVADVSMTRPRITPDVAGGRFEVEVGLRGPRLRGLSIRARLGDAVGAVAEAEVRADLDLSARLVLPVAEDRRRLWSPEDPFLYDLELELLDADGVVIDRAASYAGLRSVTIEGPAILLNGEPRFQRLVADQGYYPDGVMTAPTDRALVEDIVLAQSAGFTGARLHQKVFEERFLFHCDRLGYLVWAEFADWGGGAETASCITQWLEVLERDYSHPSIVGWCPLNESLEPVLDPITVLDDVTRGMFLAAKAADRTRPVLDVSGFSHRVPESDVFDSHNYAQDPVAFGTQLARSPEGRPFSSGDPVDDAVMLTGVLPGPWSIPYRGQPYFCSEFGGILWAPDLTLDELVEGYVGAEGAGKSSADYWRARAVATEEEFYARFGGLVDVLLDDPTMFGYCYFQLTDTYQERLGIFAFDRSAKFDVARLAALQRRPAALELEPPRDPGLQDGSPTTSLQLN